MSGVGAFYYGRDRGIEDLQSGDEFVGGRLEAGRFADEVPLVAGTTHFGALALAADAAITLNGFLVGEKPRRPQVVVPDRRVRSVAERWKGRNRGLRWHRIIGPVYDQPEHLGELTMRGDAIAGFNALVVAANVVLGELTMQGDAALTLPGVAVVAIVPGQGLTMVGDAAMTAAGSEIYGSPQLRMQGDAILRLSGTGGANASLDPTQRRGGIVSIGTRGGHS